MTPTLIRKEGGWFMLVSPSGAWSRSASAEEGYRMLKARVGKARADEIIGADKLGVVYPE